MDKEGIFLTMLKAILDKHNCSIIDVNLENRILNIDGKPDDIEKCCIEIDEMLYDYLI